jgi:hypothetical protein
MLYWHEIINDLAKTHGFVVHGLKFIWQVTNVLCVSLLSHDRYQYDSLLLSKQTWAYPRQHLQQLLWCQGRWHGADIMKECLEIKFNLSSTLLGKMCFHYANSFDNKSVYFFYSNPVLYAACTELTSDELIL